MAVDLDKRTRALVHAALKYPNRLTPCLLIGRAAQEFRRCHSRPIQRLDTPAAVRDLQARYDGVRSASPLALDDLAFLAPQGQMALLKFLEETTFPLYLLATYDNIPAVILSRMKLTIKQIEPAVSNFGTLRDGLDALGELPADAHFIDETRALVQSSPLAYHLIQRIGRRRNKSRLLEVLAGDG